MTGVPRSLTTGVKCRLTPVRPRSDPGPQGPTKVKVKELLPLSHSIPKLRTCERERSSSTQGTSSRCGRWAPHDQTLLYLCDAVGRNRHEGDLSAAGVPRPPTCGATRCRRRKREPAAEPSSGGGQPRPRFFRH